MPDAALYPISLKCDRRLCLLVGGGSAAEAKIAPLLLAKARVRVVAPAISPGILELAGANVELRRRPFEPGDLKGVFLAILATGDLKLSRSIRRLATRRGILVNAVDLPAACDFFVPAVVRRGGLSIAISTSGKSPLLARMIRLHLQDIFGTEWEEYLELLDSARRRARAVAGRGPKERARALRTLLDAETMDLLWRNQAKAFRARMEQWCVSPPRP